MPGADIKFGIIVHVRGAKRTAAELRLPRTAIREIGKEMAAATGGARRYESASRRVEVANRKAASTFREVHGRAFRYLSYLTSTAALLGVARQLQRTADAYTQVGNAARVATQTEQGSEPMPQ